MFTFHSEMNTQTIETNAYQGMKIRNERRSSTNKSLKLYTMKLKQQRFPGELRERQPIFSKGLKAPI